MNVMLLWQILWLKALSNSTQLLVLLLVIDIADMKLDHWYILLAYHFHRLLLEKLVHCCHIHVSTENKHPHTTQHTILEYDPVSFQCVVSFLR